MIISKNAYSYKGLLLIFLLFSSCIVWGQIGPDDVLQDDKEVVCETVTINWGGWTFTYTLGVGDSCDDGNKYTINDTYNDECECVGECIDDDCCDFKAVVHSLACSPEEKNPNGNVTIEVTGGTPFLPPADPYNTYDGNHVGGGLYEDDGLEPGTYTYTYWDSNGCETDVTFTISGDPCCDFKAEVYGLSCSPEEGNPDGNVTIKVSGGTPFPSPADPYDTFDGNHVGGGLYDDEGLDPGTYTYTYWDSNGCEAEVTFTISGDPCCKFKAEVLSLSCSQVGNPNASVAIQVSGGTRFPSPSDPYDTYDGNHVGSGIYEDDDLDPGTYTYTYWDSNGCEADVTFTIFEGPDASVHSVGGCSQVGDSDGNVAIQVTGGTQFLPPSDPYDTYDGNHVGGGLYEDEGLDPGTYTYTYTDSNGCSDGASFTIPDVLTAEATGTLGCGEVKVELFGGTPPYTSNYNGQQNNSGIFEFSLLPDDYELSFTDANGCGVSVYLNEPDAIALCEDFTFSKFVSEQNASTWTSQSFISGVHAKIAVLLWADNVHDILRVEINDVEILNLEAGSNKCGPSNDCNGDNKSNCAEFFVNCCDKVTFFVDGAVCPDAGTHWRLDVTCLQTWGECFKVDESFSKDGDNLNTIGRSTNVTLSMDDFVNNTLQSINSDLPSDGPVSEFVSIFPNPTNSKFYIDKSKHHYELQTARILDVSGNVVKVENILGLKDPQVDSSTFPAGLYIIEIIDIKGNVFVEKLIKN